MKLIKLIAFAALTLSLLALLLTFRDTNKRKVAFVKSAVLVERYSGMEEMKKAYEKKIEQWAGQINSAEKEFMKEKESSEKEFENASREGKEQLQKSMQLKYEQLNNLKKQLEEKAETENKEMTEAVLNQVNSFVTSYAKKHDYDLILGTTLSGNILYGSEQIDITEELIKELNKYYEEGEK